MYSFDNPFLDGLAVFFSLLFVLTIRSFLTILPQLLESIRRWKINLEIEDSHKLAGSRNLVATVLFVPACLVAYSFSLFKPDFFSVLTSVQQFLVCVGAALVYLLLRAFLNWQLEMKNFGGKTFIAANRSFFNFGILLFFIVFLSGAILRNLINDEDTVRTILLHIAGFSYIVYLYKRGQIFASVCNPFTTFLYLCSLELLPTGTLVLSAVLL